MTRDFALSVALRRLDEEIDLYSSSVGERRPVLSLSPKGSPERKAFEDDFVQCFEANEDIFLEMPRSSQISSVAYWYYLSRVNCLKARRMFCCNGVAFSRRYLNPSYIVVYGLRQGPLVLLPDDGKEEP